MKPGVEIFHVGFLKNHLPPLYLCLLSHSQHIFSQTVSHDLCNIEVAIIVLCLSNYLMRQLLSTELDSAAVSQMRTQPSHYTKLFNAHFQKTLDHIESSQYYFLLFLLFLLFTTVSPCVRYSGCPHPPPLPHSPSAARCTAPPSPVRWKRWVSISEGESFTWLGTCNLCASVKPWTCSRRGSRSSAAESSNSRNWVGGT